MSEIRLYVTTTETRANDVLDVMTFGFGEEDYAIATTEVDEKKDIWETSIYLTFEEEDELRERLAEMLAPDFSDLSIEREIIPEIDWIAKSLEGLTPVRAGRFLVHGSHDRDKVQLNDVAIEIDAGHHRGLSRKAAHVAQRQAESMESGVDVNGCRKRFAARATQGRPRDDIIERR